MHCIFRIMHWHTDTDTNTDTQTMGTVEHTPIVENNKIAGLQFQPGLIGRVADLIAHALPGTIKLRHLVRREVKAIPVECVEREAAHLRGRGKQVGAKSSKAAGTHHVGRRNTQRRGRRREEEGGGGGGEGGWRLTLPSRSRPMMV